MTVINKCSKKPREFVPYYSFQPSLMFVGNIGSWVVGAYYIIYQILKLYFALGSLTIFKKVTLFESALGVDLFKLVWLKFTLSFFVR